MSFKVKDHYYNKAKKENFVARSIYKLEEVDKKFKVISSGDRVVDLGYFPGSWIQYTSKAVGSRGQVIGIDIQEINNKIKEISNVRIYQKDIFDISSLQQLDEDGPFDVLLSDMAPKTTGIKSVDQDRSLNLIEAVFEIMPLFLKEGGNTVIKVFDSSQAQQYLKTMRGNFKNFHYLKPKATRSVSKEFFVIGMGYIP